MPDGLSIQAPDEGANRVKITGKRLGLARTLKKQNACQKNQSEHAEGVPGNDVKDTCECLERKRVWTVNDPGRVTVPCRSILLGGGEYRYRKSLPLQLRNFPGGKDFAAAGKRR